jgi:SseB protein N-terminal domain
VPEDRKHQPLLFAPVQEAACGFTLRMFRERDGSRCAVAFTSEARLKAVLGSRQRWVPLAESALRELSRPLGVGTLVVDPNLVAAPVRATTPAVAVPQPQPDRDRVPSRRPSRASSWNPAYSRVLGATAAVGAADLLMQLLS